MANKIHVYTPVGGQARDLLAAKSPHSEIVIWEDEASFADGLHECEYLLAFRPPPGHWHKGRSLKLIQSFGAGIDSLVPLDGLITSCQVANAAGVTAGPMSEFALTLVMMLRKGLHRAIAGQREQRWKMFASPEVAGATLGILGLGRIGVALAERAKVLGMRVIGTQHTPKEIPCVEKVFASSETIEVARQSDVLVCLLPLTDETRGSIDRTILEAMKPTAGFVNIGRGGIVDEDVILERLQNGALKGAAFDVFEQEPLPEDHPFWTAPNLVITPHTAGFFPDYLPALTTLFAENVALVQNGEPPKTKVDPSRGY